MMKCLCAKWPSSIISACYRSVMTWVIICFCTDVHARVCNWQICTFCPLHVGVTHAWYVYCVMRSSPTALLWGDCFQEQQSDSALVALPCALNCGNSAQGEKICFNVVTNKFWCILGQQWLILNESVNTFCLLPVISLRLCSYRAYWIVNMWK